MMAQDLFNQAQKARSEEKLDESISLYQQARDQALKENNQWIASESLHMIGLIYRLKDDYEQAGNYLKEARQEFADLVGAIDRDLSQVALKKKDFNQAEQLAYQSIEMLKDSKRIGHLGISKIYLARIIGEQGDLSQAKKIIQEGLDLIKDSPERFFESSALYELAKVEKKLGNIDLAKQAVTESLNILSEISTPDEHRKVKEERNKFLQEL